MTKKLSEQTLVENLTGFLLKDGYRVRAEVPNMGQSIDLVASRGRWLSAIEAKINNWSRALNQCKAHELVVDYVCIAVATKRISPQLENEVLVRGYGLIHFDQETRSCFWIHRPQRNDRVFVPQRRMLSCNLKKIAYVG